ncbi:MAG: hypothetical protein Fur0011_1600 [Candidatus Microgenomates bacterium]
MTKLLLQCDGGSRGNPGPAAYGFVVYDITSGAAIVLEKCGNYLGITTNNQAEYEGLLAGLTWIIQNHPNAEVLIKMDSLLIVNQIKGLYKVKSPELLLKYQAVKAIISKLPSVTISHTYRKGNSLADSLVNQALDSRR